MTAQQLRTKLIESRPATMALITFGLGFGANALAGYVTHANEVTLLTEKVAELSVKVDKMSDKLDAKGDKQDRQLNYHETRISVLEAKAGVVSTKGTND